LGENDDEVREHGNAGQGAPAGDSGVTPAMTGDGGLRLTGEGSMLGELVRAVLERALEAELTAHLGYGRNERADRGGGPGNYRNGTIAKTVQTGVGPVGLAVPRDTPARPPCAVDPGGSAGGAAGPLPSDQGLDGKTMPVMRNSALQA